MAVDDGKWMIMERMNVLCGWEEKIRIADKMDRL